MNQEQARHEKVQFSKRDHRDLGDFPSARDRGTPVIRARKTSAQGRPRYGRATLWLLLLVVAVAGAAYGLLRYGIHGDALDRRAIAAIEAMTGPQYEVGLNGARIALTRRGRLAISADALTITGKDTNAQFARIDHIDLGLSAVALLTGGVEVKTVSITSARLAMPPLGGIAAPSAPVEPDVAVAAVFNHLDRLTAAFDGPRIGLADVTDVEIDLSALGLKTPLTVMSAELSRSGGRDIQIDASLAHDGRNFNLKAMAIRPDGGAVADLTGTISGIVFSHSADGYRDGELIQQVRTLSGTADIAFNARKSQDGRAIRANLRVPDLALEIKERIEAKGDANINFEIAEGTRKIEIRPSVLKLGNSAMRFEGAVGPEEAPGQGYRFELLTNEGVMAPTDSPEPPVRFAAKASGRILPDAKRITISDMALETARGEAYGQASFAFTGTHDPAMFLILRVPKMPVAEVKQFWPITASHSARKIAIERVVGGMVEDGRIELNVQADRVGGAEPLRSGELAISAKVSGARVDTVGDIPPLRGASGTIVVDGIDTTIALESGTVYLPSGRTASLTGATLALDDPKSKPFFGDLALTASGPADAIAELIGLKPIGAMALVPVSPADISGDVSGSAKIRFPIAVDGEKPAVAYDVALDFKGLSIAKPVEGQRITDGTGRISVNNRRAEVTAKAKLNGIAADIKLVEPVGGGGVEPVRNVALSLDDETRAKIAPGLNTVLKGPVFIDLVGSRKSGDTVVADLTNAEVDLAFAGWTKSAGIPATAGFTMKRDGKTVSIRDFSLKGKTFAISGEIDISNGALSSARLASVRLNRADSVAVSVKRDGKGYNVTVEGEALDIRSLIKQAKNAFDHTAKRTKDAPFRLRASVKRLTGFNGEILQNVVIDYSGQGARIDRLQINAASKSGGAIVLENLVRGGKRRVQLESTDAGAVLRFLDIYPRMTGGRISVALASESDGALGGTVEARDFTIVNEPRLSSLVSKPSRDGSRSLSATLRKDIDTSRVDFDQGSFAIRKGTGYLLIDKGILRGSLIGTTFEGTLYDKAGAMDISGTFMPAYGLNRLFGEIPILGEILGNGSDQGLIGITYRLAGPAKNPNVLVNPVSIIAPGIFRQIFEYR